MKKIFGTRGNDNLQGTSSADKIFGGSGDDYLSGGSGKDRLKGGSGNDVLDGGSGNDKLHGGSGSDILIGGSGADYLRGGSGNDVFVYRDASDSNLCAWDRIMDFQQGKDKIDLSALLGDLNLAWGGKTALANGVWYSKSGSSTIINVDLDGDSKADLKIELKHTKKLALTEHDFIGVGVSENLEPVAQDGSAVGDEDTQLTGQVSASDPENDTLTFSVVNGPANGTVELVQDGSFAYTPNENFNGTDQFTYKVNDGSSDSNVATVMLTVDPVNDAPVAGDDFVATDEDTPVDISRAELLANDTDVDAGAKLSLLDLDTTGTKGSVTLNGEGGVRYDPTGNFDSLKQGEIDFDTFSYTVQDEHGATDTATVTVEITGVNDAPIAVADVFEGIWDGKVDFVRDAFGNVLANDSDPEGGSLILTEVNGSPDNLGTFLMGTFGFMNFAGDGSGNWSYFINADGANELTEKGSFTEVFGYTVADDSPIGALASSSTLEIHFTHPDFVL